ncbi:MAG: hypothetical protein ACE37J_01635 [Pikeienuella sp.]|uniref:hypothetical protein n=1 Tax=Pikeienuella sp. TaxID=2831957 RepID=UPI00391B1278
MFKAKCILIPVLLAAAPAAANEFEGPLRDLAETKVRALVQDPAIIAAIVEQNARHEGLTQADIDAMDKAWRAEVGAGSTPTISPVADHAVSALLRDMVEAGGGLYTEIFVMDNRGLNVAMSDTTSDYWQGDEDKWSLTYAVGPDAMDISDIELDESTQTYQSQISVAIVDPATGQPVGAATFGVNVEALE